MIIAALSTKHAKATAIAEPLAQVGFSVVEVVTETDALGTFTGTVPRRHSPIATARLKAFLAAGHPGASWLLGSEGTMTTFGFSSTLDHEVIVAVPVGRPSVTVVGRGSAVLPVGLSWRLRGTASMDDLAERAAFADLGRHLLCVVRPHDGVVHSDVATLTELAAAIDELAMPGHDLIVQTDFRAHRCPSRHVALATAAEDLAHRLSTRGPSCAELGFGEDGTAGNRPCRSCAAPTGTPSHRVARCPWCDHVARELLSDDAVDSGACGWCNP